MSNITLKNYLQDYFNDIDNTYLKFQIDEDPLYESYCNFKKENYEAQLDTLSNRLSSNLFENINDNKGKGEMFIESFYFNYIPIFHTELKFFISKNENFHLNSKREISNKKINSIKFIKIDNFEIENKNMMTSSFNKLILSTIDKFEIKSEIKLKINNLIIDTSIELTFLGKKRNFTRSNSHKKMNYVIQKSKINSELNLSPHNQIAKNNVSIDNCPIKKNKLVPRVEVCNNLSFDLIKPEIANTEMNNTISNSYNYNFNYGYLPLLENFENLKKKHLPIKTKLDSSKNIQTAFAEEINQIDQIENIYKNIKKDFKDLKP